MMERWRAPMLAVALMLAVAPFSHAWLIDIREAGPKQYVNIYGRFRCDADAIVTPDSGQQLADAIKGFAAAAKATGTGLKIRASRKVFHSNARFPCVPNPAAAAKAAAGKSSAAAGNVAVLLGGMKKIVSIDKTSMRVRVQPGVQVIELLRAAKKAGLAPPLGAPTNYADLTIGGVLSTTAHGTGFNVTSTLAQIVTEFQWVDAAGQLHTSPRDSPEARAILGGVGLIGIITEVELQLGPTRVVSAVSRLAIPDTNLFEDVKKLLQETPNLGIAWRPDYGQYSAHLIMPTDKPSKGDQAGVISAYPRVTFDALEAIALPWILDTQDVKAKLLGGVQCISNYISSIMLKWSGTGVTVAGVGIPLHEGVGDANDMIAGSCDGVSIGGGCAWDSNLTVDDQEMAIELEDLGSWISDVKKIIALDLDGGAGRKPYRCLTTGYIFMRFGSPSDTFTGITAGMKQPMYVDITSLTSRHALGKVPTKYGFIYDAIEQATLCKYKGRPHWGKNYDRTFTNPNCPIRPKYPSFDQLLAQQAKYDPDLVFEPTLMTTIKAQGSFSLSPGCDLRKDCYCQADEHCADAHKCVPSKALPEFKVCKPLTKV